jgi:DNA-binding XRE family transcriptional regulator
MPERPVPTRPSAEPLRYVAGGWPKGEVRELTDAEGGELVRYQVDQLRLFVTELTARRESRGVTQARLADLTGLRRNTISELEAGRSYPDWSTITRIAHALEADVRFIGRPSSRVEDVDPR